MSRMTENPCRRDPCNTAGRVIFPVVSSFWLIVLIFCAVSLAVPWNMCAQELALSAAEFAKLDTFEGHSLRRADMAFGGGQYRQAVAEYTSFLLEFPRSPAAPYSIYRKGRAQQLDNKRFEAIKTYNEVLDYFPDDIPYAAAALFQMGQAHWDNGNTVEALKAWAEMADEADYRKQPLAAGAVNRLADALREQGKTAEAARYYWQTAIEFRTSNGDAARHAISHLVTYYVRIQPDVRKLREFYDQVQSFEVHPRAPEERDFWERVIENIRRQAPPVENDPDPRARYFRAWAGFMADQHPDWDDFQIARIEFLFRSENDIAKWFERLDRLFVQHQKPGDYARIIKWIQTMAGHPGKVQEYYGRLDFANMDYDQINHLMRVCFDQIKDPEMADTVFGHLPLERISDDQRGALARYLWQKGQRYVEAVCGSMANVERGKMETLRYYNWRCREGGHFEEQYLTLAEEMSGVPALASEAFWLKAEILQKRRHWMEAVTAYQASDLVPGGLWRIADCLIGAGKPEQALMQLREIENFFADEASKAALRMAFVYRDMKQTPQFAAALRAVLAKYPQSSESSRAHLELEKLGLSRIGGGLDAK